MLHNQPESSQELLRRNNRELVDVMGAYTAPKAPALAAARNTRLTRVQPTGQVKNMRTLDTRLKRGGYVMPQAATPDGLSVGMGAPFDPKVLKLLQSLGARYDATGQLTTRDASRLQRAYGWQHTPDELDLVEGLMEMESAQDGPVDPTTVKAAAHPVAKWLRGATTTTVPTAVRTPPAALRTTAMPAAAPVAVPRPAISTRPAVAAPPHPAPGGGRRYPDRSLVDNVGSWTPNGAAPRPARRLPPELAPGLITGTAGAAGAYGLGQASGAVGRAYLPQPKPAPVTTAMPQTAQRKGAWLRDPTAIKAAGLASIVAKATSGSVRRTGDHVLKSVIAQPAAPQTAPPSQIGLGGATAARAANRGLKPASGWLPQLSPGMQTGLMVGGAGLGLAGLYKLLSSRRQEQDDQPGVAY